MRSIADLVLPDEECPRCSAVTTVYRSELPGGATVMGCQPCLGLTDEQVATLMEADGSMGAGDVTVEPPEEEGAEDA